MAKRSPILGFNHNFRHRGLVFHVQTEDSGVNNPHIFTHLFNGGVILSSRKLTYDVGAAEEVVKALMQAQHKAMLKDLKRGEFDTKITEYFGDHPELEAGDTVPEPGDVTEPSADLPFDVETGVTRPPSPEEIEFELDLDDVEMVNQQAALDAAIDVLDAEADPADEVIELRGGNPFSELEIDLHGDPMDTLRGPAPPGPVGETPSGAVVIHAAAPASAPEPPGANPTSPGQYAQHTTGKVKRLEPEFVPEPPSVAPRPPAGKAAVSRQRTATRPLQSEPDSVKRDVVEKPSVIVGAPPQVIGQAPAKSQTPRRAREQQGSLFGKDLISEKSLDEVILAYLSEDGSERE